MKRLLLPALLATLLAAAGCGERGREVGENGVRQTRAPGHVAAGGGTSGSVMAARPASAEPDRGPAGTPGTPQGMEGNVGGTALGGTSPQRGDSAPTAHSGVTGTTTNNAASGTSAAIAGAPGTPGSDTAAAPTGAAAGGPGTAAPGSPAGPAPAAGGPTSTAAVLPGVPGALPPGPGGGATTTATPVASGTPTARAPGGYPSPAAAGAAAAAAAPPGTPEALRQQIALAAAMDAVAARWRTRAAAEGWAAHPPTAVDPLGGIQASAQPAPSRAGVDVRVRSEKQGTAPPSEDVKTGRPAGRRESIGEKAPDAVRSPEGVRP